MCGFVRICFYAYYSPYNNSIILFSKRNYLEGSNLKLHFYTELNHRIIILQRGNFSKFLIVFQKFEKNYNKLGYYFYFLLRDVALNNLKINC